MIAPTRLSNLLATMEANRCSPDNFEIRNKYSGALTWLDRCVRPGKRIIVKNFKFRNFLKANGNPYFCTYQTVEWLCPRSMVARV
jgi:hypothetical protein